MYCFYGVPDKTSSFFSDGITPGPDWIDGFLKRHVNSISVRTTTNINRKRAAVGRKELKEYFTELFRTVEGVPASHIFNLDETNVSDDPGKERKLFRKGYNDDCVLFPFLCLRRVDNWYLMLLSSLQGVNTQNKFETIPNQIHQCWYVEQQTELYCRHSSFIKML